MSLICRFPTWRGDLRLASSPVSNCGPQWLLETGEYGAQGGGWSERTSWRSLNRGKDGVDKDYVTPYSPGIALDDVFIYPISLPTNVVSPCPKRTAEDC